MIKSTLGINFSSRYILFTELTGNTDSLKLNHTESVEIDFDFEDELSKYKSNQKILSNISFELQKYIAKRNIKFDNISLSVGSSQAFMIILPIDFSEGKQSLHSKIYWELSNYFPDNYNEYIVNTYRLNSVNPNSTSDEFLLIAVHKFTIEFLKRIFKLANLELSVIDIDYFSAEHSLRNSYSDEISHNNVLLIGLKKGRIDYGYLSEKKFRYFTYSRYYSEPEFNLSLVRKVNSILSSGHITNKIDSIYLYGENIRDDTIFALSKIQGIEITAINPFENMQASNEFIRNEDLRKHAFRYTASCGAALRGFSANQNLK